jgi:uncharacterized SAM-binding protein YcdF (DUF218 family)
MLRWMERVLAVFGLLVLAAVLFVGVTYETVPRHNCKRTHFDTIIVLGAPVQSDGNPSPEERERVMEGVSEFKAGRAEHIIFSGGAAENRFVEGEVMAELAEVHGVPVADVVIEGQSKDTIQNIYFSYKLMQQRGWTSAEVVSSPSHLPRAGLILEHYSFQWQEHAARWPPEYGWRQIVMLYETEALYTMQLRCRGFPASLYLPLKTAS